METENQNSSVTTTKNNKKTLIIVIIVAVVVVAALVAALIWALNRQQEETFSDEFFDPMAQTGIMPDMSEEEIQAELNRVVEEGMLNISIAGAITVKDGVAYVKIQNSEANHYIIKVAISRNDTGEVLYETGGIKPGQYIRTVEIPGLETGIIECTALFTAYTLEERQIVGSTAAIVTLYVGDDIVVED